MDIKPVANTPAGLQGQRISDTGNFSTDVPSVGQTAAPVQTANAVKPTADAPKMGQVEDAVKTINLVMKSLSQNLEFTIDADTERTVVKVVDKQTNEVIRQLPSQETLEIAKAMDRLQGLLIREKA